SVRVDSADELSDEVLDGAEVVGLTSGASVPEVLVDGVIEWLANHGYPNLKVVSSAEETLTFALPPELRRDLKARQAGSLA
ncbi:MAG: hypothetical protein WAV88_01785, partial [Candidatus Nanopelagicales bacterium]